MLILPTHLEQNNAFTEKELGIFAKKVAWGYDICISKI